MVERFFETLVKSCVSGQFCHRAGDATFKSIANCVRYKSKAIRRHFFEVIKTTAQEKLDGLLLKQLASRMLIAGKIGYSIQTNKGFGHAKEEIWRDKFIL